MARTNRKQYVEEATRLRLRRIKGQEADARRKRDRRERRNLRFMDRVDILELM